MTRKHSFHVNHERFYDAVVRIQPQAIITTDVSVALQSNAQSKFNCQHHPLIG